jgi:transcriptional regulator with XRE-family HTH domain
VKSRRHRNNAVGDAASGVAHPGHAVVELLAADAGMPLDGGQPVAGHSPVGQTPVTDDVLADTEQVGELPDPASGLDGLIQRGDWRGFRGRDRVHEGITSRNVVIVNTYRVRQPKRAAKNVGMAFKDNLKRAREANKLTQEQLAHAIGAAGQSRISNYESGVREPTLSEIEDLARALKTSPIHLLGWAEPLTKASPQSGPVSQNGRPAPATMLAAVDLLAFDEEQAGPYTVKGRTRRLLELYDRLTADGGEELSPDSNRQFEAEVHARSQRTTTGVADGRQRKARKKRER